MLVDALAPRGSARPIPAPRPATDTSEVQADVVTRLPLFSHLSLDAARLVGLNASRRTWPRGAHMLTQGEPAGELFVLLAGSAERLVGDPAGREIVTDIVMPGEAFGEAAIIDGGQQPASIRCTERCEALCVRPGVLARLLPHDNVLTFKLLRHLSAQVRCSRGLIRALGLPTVRERTLDRIRWLRQRGHGAPAAALATTHTALARFVGANRETVSRAVASLVADGSVHWPADAGDDERAIAGP